MNVIEGLREAIKNYIVSNGDQPMNLSKVVRLLELYEARPAVKAGLESLPDDETEGSEKPVEPDPAEAARFQAELNDWMGEREHSRQWNLENFRQVISLGQNALRNAALINGGAAVALLAFSGNLLAKGVNPAPFTVAMATFGVGVFVAVLAMACTYVSQLAYGNDGGQRKWQHKVGFGFHIATALLGLLAMLIFVKGVEMGYDGFQTTQPTVTVQSGDETFKKNMPLPKAPPPEPPKPANQQPTKETPPPADKSG